MADQSVIDDALLYAEGSVARHESLRLVVYDDATGLPLKQGDTIKGHPTIGYGRSLDLDGITPVESGILLRNSLVVRHTYLLRFDWYLSLNEARRAVVLDLSYNVGVAGILKYERMIKAIRANDFIRAGEEINDPQSTVVAWRRKELADVMTIGVAAAWMHPVTG